MFILMFALIWPGFTHRPCARKGHIGRDAVTRLTIRSEQTSRLLLKGPQVTALSFRSQRWSTGFKPLNLHYVSASTGRSFVLLYL